jgi:GT2 family glycosyltransferase
LTKAVDISCVLLTWNSAAYVKKCLCSLSRDLCGSGLSHEIIVIDNGSTDGTLEILRDLPIPLFVIPLSHNTGTTFSRNIGLRMARSQYVAILDSDLEISEPDTLLRLRDYLERNPRAGVVAPKLYYPSGNYQKTTDVFPTLWVKIKRYLYLREIEALEGKLTDRYSEPREVDYAISAFWLLARDLVEEIGYLDENIVYAPEDVDYCLRVWLAGRPVIFLPSVTAVHHAQEISRRSPLSKSMRLHMAGLAYYFRKYRMLISCRRVYRRIERALSTGAVADGSRRA